MERYGELDYRLKHSVGSADSSPVTEADLAANRVIVAALRWRYPSDAILSEESRDSVDRLNAEVVWVVDPLDGTKEYLARNGEFAVMIGLAVHGEAVLGVVNAPARDVLYAAARGLGAWAERLGKREPLRCAPARWGRLRLVGSRSHPDPLLARMTDALGITDVEPSGSVGIKCAAIAEGRRDLYIHPVPYLKEWDTCAPEVLLREAGGRVTDCRGEPLRYNKEKPSQPHGIVGCGEEIASAVLAKVAPIYAKQRGAERVTSE